MAGVLVTGALPQEFESKARPGSAAKVVLVVFVVLAVASKISHIQLVSSLEEL